MSTPKKTCVMSRVAATGPLLLLLHCFKLMVADNGRVEMVVAVTVRVLEVIVVVVVVCVVVVVVVMDVVIVVDSGLW